MSRSDSQSSVRWLIFLALVLLAPGLYLVSGGWEASLTLRGDADDVKSAFIAADPSEPLTPQEVDDLLEGTKRGPTVYQISEPAGAEDQVITVEFETVDGGRISQDVRSYACYQYRLSFTGDLSVEMLRLRPKVRGTRACTDVAELPLAS